MRVSGDFDEVGDEGGLLVVAMCVVVGGPSTVTAVVRHVVLLRGCDNGGAMIM